MSWFTTGEIIIWLLLAAILGFILGWLIRGLRRNDAELIKLRDANTTLATQLNDCQKARAGFDTQLADWQKARAALETQLADCQRARTSLEAQLVECQKARALEAKPVTLAPVTPVAPVVAPVVTTVRPESAEVARAKVTEHIATRTAGEGEVPMDDLDDVFGIGPVISKMLYGMGITSFRQIARFSPEDVATVESALEFFPDRIVRDDWMASARQKNIEKYGIDPLKN